MNAKIVYKEYKDRELLDLNNLIIPIFIEYIDITTRKGKKEGWSILNYYGTTQTPFVELQLDNEKCIAFYSEKGNAIYQLIKYVNDMNVKVKKLVPEAVIPAYAHPGVDMGMDVTAVSVEYDKVHDRFIYHTGLAFEVPTGYGMLIFPRSSNTKTDCYLGNSVGVLDSSYRGELLVVFKNRTSRLMAFPDGDENLNTLEYENEFRPYKVGERICQIVIIPYPQIEFTEVDELSATERGDGGFGSTGK